MARGDIVVCGAPEVGRNPRPGDLVTSFPEKSFANQGLRLGVRVVLVERFSVRGGASKSPKSVDHGAVHKIARFHLIQKKFMFGFLASPLSVLAQLQNPVQADTERAPALRLTSTGRRLCLASNLPFPRPRPVLRPQAARPLVRLFM